MNVNRQCEGFVMSGTRILLMRHAEKTADPLDLHLSPAGVIRANSLAAYIPEKFGVPQFLIATMETKHSRRPIETLEPLSDKTGIAIAAEFADQDYGALALQLNTQPNCEGALIVVCWHHGNIPSLARALGAKPGSYPDPWKPDVFNEIWSLTYPVQSIPDLAIEIEPF